MTIFVENHRARFDYEILEKFQAGLELLGSEVKTLRKNQGSLEGARVIVRGSEAYVINMDIPPYQPNNETSGTYDSKRTRRLLLQKAEIEQIEKQSGQKGLTVVPISVYNSGRYIKVTIAIVRGKKKFDKREDIKKRETDREMRRTLKS